MTKREGAIITAYTGILCGNFAAFHAYAEALLGRAILTHEFAEQTVAEELCKRATPDFMALCLSQEDTAPDTAPHMVRHKGDHV